MRPDAYDSLAAVCVMAATVTAVFGSWYGAVALALAAVLVLVRREVMSQAH